MSSGQTAACPGRNFDETHPHKNSLAHRVLLLIWGQQPGELVVKKLAMFGCAALVYAHAMKNKIQPNSYAGECHISRCVGLF